MREPHCLFLPSRLSRTVCISIYRPLAPLPPTQCQSMGNFGSQCYRPNVCTKENDKCRRDSDCCGSMICQTFGNFGQKCYKPPSCASAGSSCNNGKTCCAGSECMNLLGGSGAKCQKCVAKGETCNSFYSSNERCCGGRTCARLFGR